MAGQLRFATVSTLRRDARLCRGSRADAWRDRGACFAPRKTDTGLGPTSKAGNLTHRPFFFNVLRSHRRMVSLTGRPRHC